MSRMEPVGEREALKRMVEAQRAYDEALREYRAAQEAVERGQESVFTKDHFRSAWGRLHESGEALARAGEELRRIRFGHGASRAR